MSQMTFRNSKIIYYGPFNCEQCDALICRMGQEFGHNAFTYPQGPIYPNTEWHVHVCDPIAVYRVRGRKCMLRVKEKYPNAEIECVGNGSQPDSAAYRVVDNPESTSPHRYLGSAYGTTHEAAWSVAFDTCFPAESASAIPSR